MAQDFGDAHVGDIFRADQALLASALHLDAAETGEVGIRQRPLEGGDQGRAVGVAGGLTGGEEDSIPARVGSGGDFFSVALADG
jgi:hypothetical protein